MVPTVQICMLCLHALAAFSSLARFEVWTSCQAYNSRSLCAVSTKLMVDMREIQRRNRIFFLGPFF